ncbi:MAG: hypothetical protein H6818_22835 [Phycisphaerales bacterium]|nr:hypothetical protein [Phycisphaerales bacterium]
MSQPVSVKLIELEPLAIESTTAHYPRPTVLNEPFHSFVPNRPGYQCPDCDYDLRGQPGRKCPECGHKFTVGEAHLAGLSHDPLMAMDDAAIRRDKRIFAICVGIFILAFISPNLLTWSAPTSFTLFGQMFYASVFVGAGVYFHSMRGWTKARSAKTATMLYVGLITCIDAAILL